MSKLDSSPSDDKQEIELNDIQCGLLEAKTHDDDVGIKQQSVGGIESSSLLLPFNQFNTDENDLKRERTKSSLQHWVTSIFYGKECFRAVLSEKDDRCKCGRLLKEHGRNHLSPPSAEVNTDSSLTSVLLKSAYTDVFEDSTEQNWDSKTHTKPVYDLCFGGIQFSGEEYDTVDGKDVFSMDTAKYIRVPDDITVHNALIWIQKRWGLKQPKLILSFYGGHENFKLESSIQNRLQESIKRIMHTVGTWLFTDGTNVGLSELIGNTYKTHSLNTMGKEGACIGFTTWGAISGQAGLRSNENDLKSDTVTYKYYYAPDVNEPELVKAHRLDKHHSHHILVDDGTYGIHGGANTFRQDLLSTLISNDNGEETLPCVMVLVEGGLPKVNDIYQALTSTSKIPIVIVKGSGRLSDVFAELIEMHEQNQHLPAQKKHEMLRKLINAYLKKYIDNLHVYEQDLESYVEKIKICIEEHDKGIIVYDYEEGPTAFQHAILIACKGLHTSSHQTLNFNQLAILWEEKDMVETSKIKEDEKFRMLRKALVHNRVESVKLLLETNVNLENFLKTYPIEEFYKKAFNRGSIILSLMMTDSEIKRSNGKKKPFDVAIVHRIITKMTNEDFNLETYQNGKCPLQSILIWSILANQPELARCLFEFSTDSPMVTALMMSRIYRYIQRLKRFQGEVELVAAVERKYFANIALDLLTVYSRTNEDLARECLQMAHPLWGYKDAMLLAVNMIFKKFVAHKISQKVLKDIWKGLFNENELMAANRLIYASRKNINPIESSHLDTDVTNGNTLKYRKSIRFTDINQKDRNSEQTQREENNPNERRPRRITVWGRQLMSAFLWFFLVPKGKFVLNFFIYLIFVGLFSYVVISKMASTTHSIEEYIVAGFVGSYLLDEIRQIAIVKKATGSQKFRKWIKNVWNILDLFSILFFIAGFTLRYFETTILYGRVLYALDIVVWYLKIFQFYRLSSTLGPYVVMIYRMSRHLMSFIMVLFVIVIGYGIFQHTLLYPNDGTGWHVIFKMLFRPYTTVFGELGIEHDLDNDQTIFETVKENRYIEAVSILGMCVYVMFSNILLINLVIAVFNNIYQDIATNSDAVWKFERYDMIMEFDLKPILPPPFSIFENVFILTKLTINRCLKSCCSIKEKHDQSAYVKNALTKEILEFERRCMRMYLFEKTDTEKYSGDNGIKQLKQRLDANSKQLLAISEKLHKLLSVPDVHLDSPKPNSPSPNVHKRQAEFNFVHGQDFEIPLDIKRSSTNVQIRERVSVTQSLPSSSSLAPNELQLNESSKPSNNNEELFYGEEKVIGNFVNYNNAEMDI